MSVAIALPAVVAAMLLLPAAASAQAPPPDERAAAQALADAAKSLIAADREIGEDHNPDGVFAAFGRGFQRKAAAAADRMRELGVSEQDAKVFEGDG